MTEPLSRLSDLLEDALGTLREMRAEHPGVLAVLDAAAGLKEELIKAQRYQDAAKARDIERSLRAHWISPKQALQTLQALSR